MAQFSGVTSVPSSRADEKIVINRSLLGMFQPLPETAENPENPFNDAKIDLGRMLWFDKRLSVNRTRSCSFCHDLKDYGDNGQANARGHKGQRGDRSPPSAYNASIQIAQFWDGRAKDVEEQSKGPPLSPGEMGMRDAAHVESVLRSVPGYVTLFKKAFSGEDQPVTFDNMGKAIGVFERKLFTPAPFDAFLKGDNDALTARQKQGLKIFISTGCTTCHNGMGVGGHLYQKVGLVEPWPGLKDTGRAKITGNEADKYSFKVASLRNITETDPYMHDGSVEELPEMVRMMAKHQLGRKLSDKDIASIVDFLEALKGKIPVEYIKEPELPADGPDTPKAGKE